MNRRILRELSTFTVYVRAERWFFNLLSSVTIVLLCQLGEARAQ